MPLTSMFRSPLQGEGRGFETLSAHQYLLPEQSNLKTYRPGRPDDPILTNG